MERTEDRQTTIEERRAEVARRTAAGESERAIAAALRVSRTTVWTDKQVNAAAQSQAAK